MTARMGTEDPDRIGRRFWKATKVVLVFIAGFAAGQYVADRQQQNLREIVPPPEPAVVNPIAQASVDRETELRQIAEGRLERTEEALDACMWDRTILQAVQGVELPKITTRGASR